MSHPALPSAVLAALALAVAAPGAAAQVPGVDLPVEPATADIPHDTAISEQYQAVQEAVQQAVPEVPPAPAPPPVATPEPPAPDPAPQQYHSETPADVTVTQEQPTNVNVSIRINSPGDDGPVVQINNAGGSAVVEQVVEAVQRPAAGVPDRTDRESGALPENWEWTWTSACFGGAGGARAAAATPGWTWRWSCDREDRGDDPAAAIPDVPDPWAIVDEVLASTPVGSIPAPAVGFAPPDASRAPPARPERRAAQRAPAVVAAASGSRGPPGAAPLIAATAAVPSAVAEKVRHVVRAATSARPGPGGGADSPVFPGGGSAVGAGTALGAVASMLLGMWIAVLTTAIVLVLPRIRRRRRSGPAWRLKRLPSPRLERPG